MFKKALLFAAMTTIGSLAYAADDGDVAQKYELKDGSTVYVFKDGRMGMEDKFGRATSMKHDTVMETKDGKKIIMRGNALMRVESLHRLKGAS